MSEWGYGVQSWQRHKDKRIQTKPLRSDLGEQTSKNKKGLDDNAIVPSTSSSSPYAPSVLSPKEHTSPPPENKLEQEVPLLEIGLTLHSTLTVWWGSDACLRQINKSPPATALLSGQNVAQLAQEAAESVLPLSATAVVMLGAVGVSPLTLAVAPSSLAAVAAALAEAQAHPKDSARKG